MPGSSPCLLCRAQSVGFPLPGHRAESAAAAARGGWGTPAVSAGETWETEAPTGWPSGLDEPVFHLLLGSRARPSHTSCHHRQTLSRTTSAEERVLPLHLSHSVLPALQSCRLLLWQPDSGAVACPPGLGPLSYFLSAFPQAPARPEHTLAQAGQLSKQTSEPQL